MKEFNEKRRLKRLLYSKTSIIFLVIIFFFVARASWNVYKKESESALNHAKAERELSELKVRQEALVGEIQRLNTQNGIEAEIRDKYKMAKENENMVVIIDNEEKKPEASPSPGFFENFKIKIENFFKKGE